jgi:NADH-quinone oxidoreductase subunit J
MTPFLFALLGFLAIILAVFLITRRNPIAAAMLLIADFVILAAMYGLLDAHFAAAAQVIVYAGAIMVVFVFLIMMLNIPTEQIRFNRVTKSEWALAFLGVVTATITAQSSFLGWLQTALPSPKALPFSSDQNTRNVAALMFTDYLWAFELIGFLIIAAMIGAVVIAKHGRKH